jgi:DNA-binding XRE family transcriptional regulator
MRKDKWNEPRIEYWQAIYEALKEKFRKKGIDFREGAPAPPKKEDDFCKSIADRIKILRKQKGLTQCELARKLGVSQQMVSRIERGRENISLLTLKNIVGALDAEARIEII